MNMDTIVEGSHEGMSTSSRKLSTREVEANAQLEQLKRENERLRVTKTKTNLAPIPDESPRTLQAREQLEQLRLENERMMASRLAPSAPPMSSRTYQNLNQSVQAPEPEKIRGAGYPIIAGYPIVPDGSTRTAVAEPYASKTSPNMPPAGMSPRTMQAMEELNALKQESDNLKASKLAPKSVQQAPQTRTVQAAGDQQSRVSPRTVQALEELNNLKQENEKLAASKVAGPPPPSRVGAADQMSRVSPRTVQALEELNVLKKENEKLAASKLAAPSRTVQGGRDQGTHVSPRTEQALGELNALKEENERLVASKVAAPVPASRTVQGVEHGTRASPRTEQALGELNALKVENERLAASKVAAPVPASRTVQGVEHGTRASPRTEQALGELNALKEENERLAASKVAAPVPASRTIQGVEHGTRASPRTEQALGVLKEEKERLAASKVAAPVPASRTVQGVEHGTRASPRTEQALGELNALKEENERLAASKVASKVVAPSPVTKSADGVEVAEVAPNLEQQGSFSFKIDTVKSPETEKTKAKETVVVDKTKANETVVSPVPVMSSRTIAQIRNDPALVEVKTKTAPAAAMPPVEPSVSGRTLQVMEELEKMKKENELLKASKVNVPAGMSDRTRQVMEQLEKVKKENAALMASKVDDSATKQRRLAYLEQNHAIASKARTDEIKKMILTGQELDLAFLVDATGSMQSCINLIKDTVTNMAAGIKGQYPDCKMRVAFAPYRDYEDTVKDDDEACDFTSSFTGADSTFVRALSRVRASGGGDDAEDVFTGIARVAGFNWNASNRLLIHIADAPCHGIQFHDGVGDHYPAGDKYGRSIDAQLKLLYERCKVSTYFFCHLNTSTRKMLQEFKRSSGGALTIVEEQFANITKIPEKVVTLCRGTIQKTLTVVAGGAAHITADMKYVNEVVVTAIPSWSDISLQTGSHYKHKWYRALDDLLSKINRKMAIDEEVVDHVQVQIAKHPFSSDGAVRWPYYAKITRPSEAPQFMVVKRFKTALNKDVREVHKRDRYLAQMEVQSVAAQMAEEFNSRTSNFRNVKKVEFTQVTTLEVGSGSTRKFFNMEEVLEGTWIRYSNNGGYVNTSDYAAVLQAFTHWTHERSRGLLMVTDLQGVRLKNEHGESVFRLCDPAIHCTDVMRFTRTNLGAEGFKLFFDTHKCNDVCKHLGLAVGTAGRTMSGTHVGKYW